MDRKRMFLFPLPSNHFYIYKSEIHIPNDIVKKYEKSAKMLFWMWLIKSAVPSKNAVSENIKDDRYGH